MDDIDFCPFCSAQGHKVVDLSNSLFFCKNCNKFFILTQKVFLCPKCSSKKIVDSEFPSPAGELVFQCDSCKKMYTAKEFLQKTSR